ncbi:hypothetical protein TWF225_007296 [Orbilia oligospora]|nr:hypothetical protein TWF225_007296 [Orbilia oligospora]KAF3238168.1 hypothetical protein TWF128_000677 [Orbilia oligospora]KAF3241772.1 hypothetical protein TWF217_011944 [Orbilia oligospora]
MKFAKQLENNLVPEWRIKYLDYKGAKKKLKAVRRAIRNAEAASASTLGHPSPRIAAGITQRFRSGSTSHDAASSLKQHLPSPIKDTSGSYATNRKPGASPVTPVQNGLAHSPIVGSSTPGQRKHVQQSVLSIQEDEGEDEYDERGPNSRKGVTTPDDTNWKAGKNEVGDENERRHLNPLSETGQRVPGSGGYGSISPGPVGVRPASIAGVSSKPSLPPALDLPEPARPLEDRTSVSIRRARTYDSSLSSLGTGPPKGERTPRFVVHDIHDGDVEPHTVLPTDDYGLKPSTPQRPSNSRSESYPIFKNVFDTFRQRVTSGGHRRPASLPNIRNAQIYLEMTEDAQKEFFNYLAEQLHKINDFYIEKETEAKDRLARIEHQVSIMTRNRILEKERERRAEADLNSTPNFDWKHPKGLVSSVKKRISMDTKGNLFKSGTASPEDDTTSCPTIAKLASSALEDAAGPAQPAHRATTDTSLDDYTRRTQTQHVRYKTAKRKLKAALIEYYHSLELLKSYSVLNREAFRKIIKKFDKTAHTHIASKYLEEKVHPTSFASSEEIEKLIARTEDIFATHYEKGRRKHAVERLRTREQRFPASGAVFRAGLYLGMSITLLVQALYQAFYRLEDGYGMRHDEQVSYLLQIWAGFAFPTIFMLLFSVCCRAWVRARINYVFIFEFDTRNKLDWRELLELPAMFAFVQVLLMWFCFSTFWGDGFDRIWFPVIYVGLVLVVLFNPFKFGYFHTRKWLLYTLYRLFWAGYYPVEFRDFWSGDIFCSLTYTMGNIPLFFCLWTVNWDTPGQCNSSHSRLLGFFTALPSIWRLLQCFRRYHDTRNAFPHLANAAKYGCGILYYMTLSMWRIDKGNESIKAAFIIFAGVNAFYTSTWDLLMDWSLLNWYAPNRLLRTELAFRRPIAYYLAMIVDPIIRFSWIFYVIFANQVQHSALLSFIVSLAEVGRRFIWCFFRMENEHCANVNKFRAYKDDVPLPYNVPLPSMLSQTRRTSSGAGRTPRMSAVHARVTDAEARVEQEIAAVSGGLTPLQVDRRPSTSRTSGAGIGLGPGAMEAGGVPQTGDLLPDRTPLLRAYTLMTTAHAQDFERKRPSTGSAGVGGVGVGGDATLGGGGGAGVGGVAGNTGRFRGYLTNNGYEDDDDDDDDYSESEEGDVKGKGDEYGSEGYASSLAEEAVEGMAGLSLRRTRTGGRGSMEVERDGGSSSSGATASATGYRGTGAVLSPTSLPRHGGSSSQPSPGIGPSNRATYAARDYERSGKGK